MKIRYFFAISCLGASLLATSAQATNVKGTVQGFNELRNGDDYVDGAIVVPTVRPAQLLSLQLDALISPNETMEAGPTSLQVPGNLYFPSQSESYGFFNVGIRKESFTHVAQPGWNNELAALSFRAPFSRLVDMGQNNAPMLKMLALIKLKNMAFESDRDWSQQQGTLRLNLNQVSQKGPAFSWTRPAPKAHETDLVVNFQKTPANRWLVTDFLGENNNRGQLNQFPVFQPEFKVAFIRAAGSQTDSKDQMPVSAVGHFRNAGSGAQIDVAGVPQGFAGVSIVKGTDVQWTPINQQGWVAVIRTTSKTSGLVHKPSPFDGLVLGLGALNERLPGLATQIEAWVNPASGLYQLSKPLGESKISLVFIGTDRPVDAPSIAVSDEEPAIFTYASEIKFVRIP